jgi:hypothetical protein
VAGRYRQPSSVADGRGRCRPTSSARPFDGTSGGRGNTRDLTGMSWLGYGGPATICGAEAISGVDPTSSFDAPTYVNRSLHADVPFALRIRELMGADLLGSRALVRAEIRRVVDYSAKLGRRRRDVDDADLFTVLPTNPSRSKRTVRPGVVCPTGHREFGSHRGTRLRSYGSLECPSRSGISGAHLLRTKGGADEGVLLD